MGAGGGWNKDVLGGKSKSLQLGVGLDDYSGVRSTQAKTNAPISQTSLEDPKLITQTYQMRNKELKKKLGQLEEEISKASLPVSADLCDNYKSIILETDQRKMYPS